MFDDFNRQKQRYEMLIVVGITATILSFILFLPVMSQNNGLFIIILIGFIGGSLMANHYRKKIKEMSIKFKERFVSQELQKIFPDSTYRARHGFIEDEVVQSNLLKKQDRFLSEDMIVGEFDGVQFRCSDVHQKDVRGSGKHRRVVTVFQGSLYEFDFFKNFKYQLLLIQPGNYRPFTTLNKIKLESIRFNSEMKVYAQNDHEAFYILTPHFMEKLLILDQRYQDKIGFSFINNKLYIAIDSRVDNFDILPFRPINQAMINDYVDMFHDIKGFIRMLTLNSRLFK